MDPWIWWVIAAGVLGVLEVVTGGTLVFIMLSSGALAAGLVSGLGGGPLLAVGAFAAVSVTSLLGVRPLARRHLRVLPSERMGVAALIGADAFVESEVGPHSGLVKLAGEVWSARSYDGESVYVVGERVNVLEIAGATALVSQ